MKSSSPPPQPYEDDDEIPPALTAEQAEDFRRRHPSLSLWRVIGAQLVWGGSAAGLAWLVFDAVISMSVGCGVIAVALPAAVFARGISPVAGRSSAAGSVLNFLVWELVKLVLTAALLAAAFSWLDGLNGLAVLAGMVVAMKVYWVALLWRR